MYIRCEWIAISKNKETQIAEFDVERFPDGFELSFQFIKIWFGGQWTEELHYLSEVGEQISTTFEPSHQKHCPKALQALLVCMCVDIMLVILKYLYFTRFFVVL